MKLTLLFTCVLAVIAVLLFSFRPNNVEGPRVPVVKLTSSGFPYHALDAALDIAFPDGTHPQEGPRFDQLKAHPEALDRYLGLISQISPRNTPHRFLRREERLAFILNAYTAGLLSIVRDHCPLESVDDPYYFGGLFWRVSLLIGGEQMSLNDLANRAAALSQGDLRVMFALSQLTNSHLALRRKAWRPDEIEQGLNELENQLLRAPFVIRDQDQLILGAPFKWYELRFNPDPLGYLKQQVPQLTQGINRVRFAEIDRRLKGRCLP